MNAPRYAEIGVTTNFSFLEGGSHPQDYVHQASRLGLDAIGIADRNTLAGVVRAYSELDNEELAYKPKLLIGARLCFVDGTPDVLAYPTDRAAYGRLCRLLSAGKLRAGKGECHLTFADLEAFVSSNAARPFPSSWPGLTRPSTSLQPRVLQDVDARDKPGHDGGKREIGRSQILFVLMPPYRFQAKAITAALERLTALNSGNVWLALAPYYRGDDKRRLARLRRIAAAADVPGIATNDVLYHHPSRRALQDVLTCVRDKTTIDKAGRRLEGNAERHLKPAAEMARLFRADLDAVAETLRFADRISFTLDELKYHYPDEPVPPGKTAQQHLEDLTREGIATYFPNGISDRLRATIAKELTLIAKRDYAHYFLTVHDIVRYARSQNILCQGRGSAANSAVCYVLGITCVDPTEIDLLFERFVSEERDEPPDIDVDFEHSRREEVMQYIYRRYGRHRAAIVSTVIHYRPRSAIRDVGKALGLSEDVTAALADTVWGSWGKGLSEMQVRQAGLDPTNPMIGRAVELATELIGFPRHLSQHVGGYVLTQDRLDSYVPIGNAAMADRTFIEWDKDDIDAVKMMKVDVLALGMLTCIRKGFDLIAQHKGVRFQLSDIKSEDDNNVYQMLQRGESIGVFQVESRAQMNMLPRLKPRCFYDLVIEVAIVRPGPIQGDMVHPYLRRRNGQEPVVYPSPSGEAGDKNELQQILGKTLGVPLFQEQAMRIAIEAAHFTPDEANQLRRAMATFRNVGTIGKFESKMIGNLMARGYDATFAKNCFEQIKGFGSYGFPESHAASFAKLVYVSAWMKCEHPDAFCCALLNSQPMGFYAPAQIVGDARANKVEVRPVDVSFSDGQCTLEERCGAYHAVRLGFRQIDGFRWADPDEERVRLEAGLPPSDDWAARIVAARARGPFGSLEQFARITALPKRALILLADADAFRSLGLDRRAALWAVRRLPDDVPLPLFEAASAREQQDEQAAPLPQMPMAEHVVADYQTVRLSLKGHPLEFLRAVFATERVVTCREVSETRRNGRRVRCAGVVLVRQRPGSASGVIFMTIEDETGIANIVVWPSVMEKFRKEVMGARLILVEGKIQASPEGVVHLVAERLVDRSSEMGRLSEGLARPPLPTGADLYEPLTYEPLNGDRRDNPDAPAQRLRHPRDVRILPPSRDFH
ncbi:DNA polymerase III, alpha subunit [Rhodopseudomonas palustris HaA2]|uniref:Error-prone DNA polymerase n=1 Tax=Rhodopseudomonas palustris (strain HaA2) TaxID=316058 RepID=DNAE2_RHOP2|nr:error-prone DNA polymerase [Rhodopseudomonas palustris]Q2IU52.1 RecName: Full=Error-prone DNA polymerase [Rhodopseudomonas palustris HaA2]ABD08258.1 DNA polymerase III, alpha subunit [Rhodopseudomonas palustris HaA2]